MIEVKNLTKSYGDFRAVDDLLRAERCRKVNRDEDDRRTNAAHVWNGNDWGSELL